MACRLFVNVMLCAAGDEEGNAVKSTKPMKHGYETVLYNVASPSQAAQRLMELPNHPLSGLIVISLPLSDADAAELASAPFPIVLVDTKAKGLPSVGVDDRLGGHHPGCCAQLRLRRLELSVAALRRSLKQAGLAAQLHSVLAGR